MARFVVSRKKGSSVSSEVVQAEQRKANLEAIVRLGFSAYPNKFDTTHSVSQLVDNFSAKTAQELDTPKVDTIAAGRIVSVRSFGKASFFVLSDGRSRIQVYVRQDALSERDYALSKLLDLGDRGFGGRSPGFFDLRIARWLRRHLQPPHHQRQSDRCSDQRQDDDAHCQEDGEIATRERRPVRHGEREREHARKRDGPTHARERGTSHRTPRAHARPRTHLATGEGSARAPA